jgi:thiosulfate/3-mercaptopyruvate sulfurtransferase
MNYPNERLLVGVDWLRDALRDEGTLVLDVRAGRDFALYEAGHIAGALPFSLSHALGLVDGTPACLLEHAMTRQLAALGVRPEQTIVLYDDAYSTALTQSFWAFERIGQREVRVLDGGFQAWQAAHLPTRQGLPETSPAPYHAPARDERLATWEWTATHLAQAQLLDARTPQEWCSGHIPGAVSCNWTTFAVERGEAIEPASATIIEARLAELGVSPKQETATYCRSGARASWLYFVLRLMGWERVRLYDGSMNDWLLREQEVQYGPDQEGNSNAEG